MKLKILFILIFISKISIAQYFNGDTLKWFPADKPLTSPKSYGFYNTIYFINGYDTVGCMYKTNKNKVDWGWKKVYVYRGMYIDSPSTMHVFFNKRMKPISNVVSYCFLN